MTNLKWTKCEGDQWCTLSRVNLDHPHFKGLQGVYIIWHGGTGGTQPWTVYVGQGAIAERLAEHRRNPEILKYSQHGGLFVTWAQWHVLMPSLDGMEKFLADTLKPRVGSRHPSVASVEVNLPW